MRKTEIQNNGETAAKITTAYLVGIQTQECGEEECAELLGELETLCGTLGLQVVGKEIAKHREPNPRYLIGSGKAKEITSAAHSRGADAIIFDDSISPSQQRNWESLGDIAVIDRQEVILDIFAEGVGPHLILHPHAQVGHRQVARQASHAAKDLRIFA